MIRPFTFVCALLACGSGLYLYSAKHDAQMLDRDIGRVLKTTAESRARIEALKGEWQNLNDTDRLRKLSETHLTLKTMDQAQLTTMADLGSRLPAPAPGASYLPMDEAVPAPAPAPNQAPQAIATRVPPARPAPVASVVAMAAPIPSQAAAKPHPPVQVAAAPPAPMPARPSLPIVSVSASPIVAASRAPTPAPGMSIGESVMRTARANAAATAPAVMAAPSSAWSAIAPAQAAPAQAAPAQAAPAMVSSSMLGGTRPALPAPVPYAAR